MTVKVECPRILPPCGSYATGGSYAAAVNALAGHLQRDHGMPASFAMTQALIVPGPDQPEPASVPPGTDTLKSEA